MKAVSDKTITTIVTLILAVLALVVIWIFLSKVTPHITATIQKFTCNICKTFLPDFICGKC